MNLNSSLTLADNLLKFLLLERRLKPPEIGRRGFVLEIEISIRANKLKSEILKLYQRHFGYFAF